MCFGEDRKAGVQVRPTRRWWYLVGQVGCEIAGAEVVGVTGQADVTVAKEDHVGVGAGDQKEGPHVELLALQEQWPLHVPGGQRVTTALLRDSSLA